MLRLLFGALVGAALAYFLDPKAGRRRRESAMARLHSDGLAGARDEFDRIKERVREKWSAITDEELEGARGNMDALIGMIRAKTGEAVEIVREQLYRPSGAEPVAVAR